MNHVLSHFKKRDPLLHAAIVENNIILEPLDTNTDHATYFLVLSKHIIGQQLAGNAARAITNRFLSLFPNNTPTPPLILETSDETLRTVGMSYAKIRYVKSLAQHTKDKNIDYAKFSSMKEQEIRKQLTKVTGIGDWTVDMFLMFTLGYEDLFSIGDLGLRNATIKLHGLRKTKTVDAQILKISKKWSPYRTYASRALWQYVDSS